MQSCRCSMAARSPAQARCSEEGRACCACLSVAKSADSRAADSRGSGAGSTPGGRNTSASAMAAPHPAGQPAAQQPAARKALWRRRGNLAWQFCRYSFAFGNFLGAPERISARWPRWGHPQAHWRRQRRNLAALRRPARLQVTRQLSACWPGCGSSRARRALPLRRLRRWRTALRWRTWRRLWREAPEGASAPRQLRPRALPPCQQRAWRTLCARLTRPKGWRCRWAQRQVRPSRGLAARCAAALKLALAAPQLLSAWQAATSRPRASC